jgi:23S rRNA maturation-related 3'-5' exoribonuclease YhaM
LENLQNQKAPRKRRNLSGEKKYQVLEEIKRNPGKKAEILRREGLYQNDIKRYEEITRDAGIKALGQMRPGKKRQLEVPIEQYEAMRREHEAKEKALAELTVEFLALKKKVNGE